MRAEPTLGIVALGLGHDTLPGMVGDPRSHPAGTLVERVHADDLLRRAAEADPGLFELVAAAGRSLVSRGATVVATSCGYFPPFRQTLAEALAVPVATSPMMMLPTLLASLAPGRKVLVVAAIADGVDRRCLRACGVPDHDLHRVVTVGMDRPGHFADAILAHRLPPRQEEFARQLTEVVTSALDAEPDIGAVVLECGEMPAAGAAVRAACGLPVVDYASYLENAIRLQSW
jgi:hypothetical protein